MFIKSAKQRKTEKVYKSFEHISRDYDAMNDIISFGMHRVWKLKVAEEIKRRKYRRILDVCCGTGDMALLLAAQNPEAAVTAVDFSGQMLERAKRRQKKKQLQNVEFLRQNAEKLEFRAGYFDCAIISFGLRNVADYEKVLRQMYRVVRPGGFVYCLDSSTPEDEKIRPVYEAYRSHVVPLVSGALAGKAMDYKRLANVNGKFMTKEQLARLMQKCGFQNVGYFRHLCGVAACHRGQRPET